MNKITVDNNKINSNFEINTDNIYLDADTLIIYKNTNIALNFTINTDIKVFEYISNSNLNNNYNINSNFILNRFSLNSGVEADINLNKENISLNYIYSTLNYDNNTYKVNINHNKKNTNSKIINHGINLKDNSLNFIINGLIKKESSNCICLQDSKIILMGKNTSKILPKLEVYNNNITANHSAYIGKFKEAELFYLKSRGIKEIECNRLLSKAFLINNMEISFAERDMILQDINNIWR